MKPIFSPMNLNNYQQECDQLTEQYKDKKFIAKKDTWYDEGTEAKLLFVMTNVQPYGGLFSGIKDGRLDEEGCSFDEFEILENI